MFYFSGIFLVTGNVPVRKQTKILLNFKTLLYKIGNASLSGSHSERGRYRVEMCSKWNEGDAGARSE